MDFRIQRVLTLMSSDLHRELSLEELARTVNLTPEHLCRLFKAGTGESPLKYRKRLRIQKARELLETTFLSVKEIMFAVGVNDASHFVRDFEAAYGLSPTQYRAHFQSLYLSGAAAVTPEIKIGQ
ncbi:MAG: helix-turn-helix domain-containing protein [Pyrinomonadaceae bacterium]